MKATRDHCERLLNTPKPREASTLATNGDTSQTPQLTSCCLHALNRQVTEMRGGMDSTRIVLKTTNH
ncbi:hypothetical protein E2C01_088213 [Portunus trituberculatus]|uniref:Uncharacterized protein n=1 Tax=Portunus trituberculatus TaxID=210409 RepID=A0A5B7JLB3_PORTR|nr:hypothetical protein [Portunus trituberculatus]